MTRYAHKLLIWMMAAVLLMKLPMSVAYAACPPPQEGLVAWWKLDQSSGLSIPDSSGHGETMTIDPSGTWLPSGGIIDGALQLEDNTSQDGEWAQTGVPALPSIQDRVTLSFWFKDNGTTSTYVNLLKFGNFIQTTGWSVVRNNTNNSVYLRMDTSAGTNQGTAEISGVFDGNWHNIAYVVDSGNVYGYLDGNFIVSDTYNHGTGFANTADPVNLGANYDLHGYYDDVRIYNRALSADEIEALYLTRSTADSTAGTMVYDAQHSRMTYCNGTDWVMMGTGTYNPDAVTFDGTNDYLVRNASLTGVTDGDKFSASFWFKLHQQGTDTDQYMYQFDYGNFDIAFDSNGTNNDAYMLTFWASNTAYTTVSYIETNEDIVPNVWYHALMSSDSTLGVSHMYINDVSDVGYETNNGGTMDFTDPSNIYTIGAFASDGSKKFDGELADFWLDFGTYIDFSLESNRRKFASASGMPMYLGPDGSVPTGSPPDIFLSGDDVTFSSNRGTAGAFTTTGALAAASSQPAENATPTGSGGVCPKSKHVVSGKSYTNCAIKADGSVVCWGDDTDGIVSGSPSGNNFTGVSTAWGDACAVKNDGSVVCWGYDGSGVVSGAPTTKDFVEVDVGLDAAEYACGVKKDTTIECWGDTIGTFPGTGWAEVSGGWTTVCARKLDNTMSCIGNSTYYAGYPTSGVTQVGNGDEWGMTVLTDSTLGEFPSGQPNPGGSGYAFAVTGYYWAGAIKTDGSVYTWDWGPTDTGGEPAGNNFLALSVGDQSACAINADGALSCWGDDTHGQVSGAPSGTFKLPNCSGCSGATNGTLKYNDTFHVMQYCNGVEWVAMGPVGGTIPTTGLVSHWKLDETSGTTLADDFSTNDATWQDNGGSATILSIDGILGKAISTHSLSDGAGVGDSGTLFDAKTDFSVAAWAKVNSTSQDGFILWKAESGAPWEAWNLLFDGPAAAILFDVSDTLGNIKYAKWNGPVRADTWYHVVGVKQGTTLKVYVNGVDSTDTSTAFTGTVRDTTQPMYFGDPWGSNYADVDIDDAYFYDHALTPTEVQQLYHYGRSGGLGGTIGDCTSPAMPEGSMLYNVDHNVMQYCNGAQWIGIGQ